MIYVELSILGRREGCAPQRAAERAADVAHQARGDPADRLHYTIGILRDDKGRGGSRELHEINLDGVTLAFNGPRNHFPLQPAESFLFIAGGIGITPILPMVIQTVSSGTPWKLIYGGRNRRSMAFLDQLQALRSDTGRAQFAFQSAAPNHRNSCSICSLCSRISETQWTRA